MRQIGAVAANSGVPAKLAAFYRHSLVQSLLSDRITLLAGLFIVLVVVASIFAPWVAPYSDDGGGSNQSLHLRHEPPLSDDLTVNRQGELVDAYPEGSRFFVLGTDHLGRDMVSRLIYGGRISLAVAFSGVVIASAIGVFLGLVAGYYKGLLDDVIMRVVDVFMSVPSLLMALMILYILGPSFTNIILVFAISRWMLYCRVSRGVVLSLRETAFVDSARAIGCSDGRILVRHILPNLITPILTLGALDVPRIILTEASLSFLGFGIQPPDSSWGLMLNQGREYITSAWWVVTEPGVAIFLTALSFNLFGIWMRGVSDPLQRWRWMRLTREARAAGIRY